MPRAARENGASSLNNGLGRQIRAERLKRGLRQSDLAKQAGLSPSALSQIENGVIDPSIGSLRRIARVLDVPIFRFLADDHPLGVVVRRHERRTLTFPESALTYQALTPDSRGTVDMLYVSLAVGGSTAPEPLSHGSDEVMLVLSGTIDVQVEDEVYRLEAGDSMFIRGGLRHRSRNVGQDVAEIIFAVSPPNF